MAPLRLRTTSLTTSLRSRLAQVSLLASVPLFLLLLAGALQDRDQVLDDARARALDLARLGARQQDELIQEAVNLVRTLGRIPDVAGAVPDACHGMLRQIDSEHPRIDGLSVTRQDGTVICDSRNPVPKAVLSDRPYFQAAIRPGAPPYVVSDLLVSRRTGKPSVAIAGALPGALAGQPANGAIVTVVGLQWFARLARQGTRDMAVQVLDVRSGTVLAQSPAPSAAQPDPEPLAPDPALLAALRSGTGEGTVDVTDHHGVHWLLGYVPLPGYNANLALVVGFDANAVSAQAESRLRRGVTIALAAMSAALLLALAFARWSLLGPIEALAAAAGRLGAGDLAARAQVGPRVAPELRALATAFDTMADRLAATRASLAESEAHHRVLAESASDMITRFGPDFRRIYVSPAARDLIGFAPEELVGQTPGGIVHPDDWPLLDATLNRPLQRGEPSSRATYRAIHKDGHSVWLESIGRRLPGGEGFVVVTRDVSVRIELEEQLRTANEKLEALVMQDGLTGLANRRCFDAMLLQELRHAERVGTPVAVAVIDIDNFKKYNDTYGHPAGDKCLRTVAGAIAETLRRAGDLAARWGGEEFVILLPGTGAVAAHRVAESIRAAVEALDLPHSGGVAGHVTVSIGVAASDAPTAADGPTLIAVADGALYAAKQAGRNTALLAGAEAAPGHSEAETNHPP